MIGGVSRRCQRFDGPAIASDHTAVGKRDVGTKIEIGAGVEPAGFADMKRARQAMRTFGVNRSPGCCLDLGHGRRMVAMRVGDKNVGDGFAAHRIKQSRDVGIVIGAGIENGNFAAGR